MKKIIWIFLLSLMAVNGHAACTGEIKNAYKNTTYKSVIVETEYKINGQVVNGQGLPCAFDTNEKVFKRNGKVCIGGEGFNKLSGTDLGIIERALAGVAEHCGNIISRLEANATFINDEKAKRMEYLKLNRDSDNIVLGIKDALIGQIITVDEKNIIFKGKIINVKADSTHSITDIVE